MQINSCNNSFLQSPLLCQNDGFCPVKSDCDSVQIDHTGQFHWVTSALLNDTITLYDSRFNEKPLSSSLQIQLALIYKSRREEDDNCEKTLFVEIPAEYNNSQVHQTVDVLPLLLLFMLVCL